MKRISLEIGILLIIIGAFVSFSSELATIADIDWNEKEIASVAGSNVLAFEIFDNYDTSLTVNINHYYSLGDFPKLRIYNQKEEIIFSYPITNFPIKTNPISTGMYSVVLDDVELVPTSRLNITRMEPVKEAIFPLSAINSLGTVTVILGIFSFSIGSILFIIEKPKLDLEGDSENNNTSDFENYIKFSDHVTRALTIIAFAFFTFITVYIFIIPRVFSLFSFAYNDIFSLVTSGSLTTLFAIYAIYFEKIIRSKKLNWTMEKVVYIRKLSTQLVITSFIFAIILVILILLSLIFSNFTIFSLGFFTYWTICIFFIPFSPFTDIFDYKGLSIVFLKLFKAKYNKSTNDADFSLITNSTANIVRLLKPYFINISAQSLSLGIVCKSLETKNFSTLDKLIDSLEKFPENIDTLLLELKTVTTDATNLQKIGINFRYPRLSYEQSVRIIKFVSPVIPLIVAVIQYFL